MFAVRHHQCRLLVSLLVVLAGCGSQGADAGLDSRLDEAPNTGSDSGPAATTASSTVPAAGSVSAAPAVRAPRTEKWIDLAVGECLADPPPSDPGAVTVEVVDCTQPHAAEVYARIPVAVNTAIAAVADRDCAAGLTEYAGQTAATEGLRAGYLIDSNQDRTDNNPQPSTIICLLQGPDGGALTGSARR